MKRYCLALDLKDDPQLIAQYESHHEKVWPEVIDSISSAGILSMQIFRVSNRLFMIMDAEDDFDFFERSRSDSGNPRVIEWEELMWKYQQALPMAAPGEKWVLMKKVFDLESYHGK